MKVLFKNTRGKDYDTWVHKLLSGVMDEYSPVSEILLQLEICSFVKGICQSSKSNVPERGLLVQKGLTSGFRLSQENM